MLNRAAQNKALQMTVFGMDGKAFSTLEFAMQKMGKGMASFVNAEDSEAAIFNLDNPDAQAQLKKYQLKHPDNAIIILSVKAPAEDDYIFIKKPFDMEALLGAIREVQKQKREKLSRKNSQAMSKVGAVSVKIEKKSNQKLSPVTPVVDFQTEKNKDRKFCGSAEDIDLGDPEQRKNIYYSAQESLQGKLQEANALAKQKNQVIIVAIKFENDLETITLLPRINKVITALDEKKLSYLCTAPLYCLEIKVFRQNAEKSKELEALALKRQGTESVDALLWNVALWTSRGRIPNGVSINTPVYLKHWPNFTRLHVTPGAFSIAALLHDKPMPLSLLIKLLAIPQRYVFAFYSGACALDLIVTPKENAATAAPLEKEQQAHPHRKLFGMIMQKLKRVG